MNQPLINIPKVIQNIETRINEMLTNYSGCDWCCGGGDEEMAWLENIYENLTGQPYKN